MAKWGIWAAHRYLEPAGPGSRRVGPDGRMLQAPWRVRSERAVLEARRRRASRAQSPWPKLLGWLCIGVASVAATMPVAPLPSHVPLSEGTRPGPESVRRTIVLAAPQFEVGDGSFRWQSESAVGSATFVLLGEDYRELARRDGIDRDSYRPSGAVAERLRAGVSYHAFVLFDDGRGPRRSELCSFAWQ